MKSAVWATFIRFRGPEALDDKLGKGKSYGSSTTHWDKLTPKVDSGGAGGCPLLLVGMRLKCYDAQT